MSNRDVLATATPKMGEVDIGDGRRVRIRALSGAGRVRYSDLHSAAKERGGLSAAEVVAMAVVEESGTLTYDVANPADLEQLQALDGAVLDKIALEFYKLSGLAGDSVERAEKNS